MVNIDTLTHKEFQALPLVVEGESKEVRYAGNGLVVIRLKPTIYSYTQNRTGIITGSDTARLKVIQKILPVLRAANIEHTYQHVNDRWILSELVLQPVTDENPIPFRPSDLSAKQLSMLPKAPPIEVIGKVRHTGTSKHRYYRMSSYLTRQGNQIQPDQLYSETVIRFDWRNPMRHPTTNERLADEVLCDQMADWFIDVSAARQTANRAFEVLQRYFAACALDLWDICFFIDESGTKLFGEVSPDCMRIRAKNRGAMDKDIWRAGGSSKEVLKKWQQVQEMLQ